MNLFGSFILIIVVICFGLLIFQRLFKRFKRRKELREFLYAIMPEKIEVPELSNEDDMVRWMRDHAHEMGYKLPEEIEDEEEDEDKENGGNKK